MAKFQSKLSYHDNFQMDKVNSLEKEINTWMVLWASKHLDGTSICLVWLYNIYAGQCNIQFYLKVLKKEFMLN